MRIHRILRAGVALAFGVASALRLAPFAPAFSGVLTPYPALVPLAAFVQAAVLDLDRAAAPGRTLLDELRAMRDAAHVNAISVYGLETCDATGSNIRKDALLAGVRTLRLKLIVRLDAYDPTSFAFTTADLDWIFERYGPLLRYLATPDHRDLVAYVALNMPVDDPAVQQRLGGINSALSRQRQPAYAAAFVERFRRTMGQDGYPGAVAYLGVTYGWDDSYDLPSYAAARPDGYYLTNYSYPEGAVADEHATVPVLLNQPRLQAVVDHFQRQYGTAPVVVEYGFHTVAYDGTAPTQSAGLVATYAAKQKALPATTAYYRGAVPSVVGTSYFGYNVFKPEGDPAVLLDWALEYPPG